MTGNIILTDELRLRLTRAIIDDDTLDMDGFDRVNDALGRIPYREIIAIRDSNGTDGESDNDIVAIALDYYGLI